ncbi:MAG TPA: tetratricopeptide repeat protein [Polyangia bacterium]|jgi:ferric-dicitrate binding protein FerR (iron transport regulator)|nr:tetratricopeptide repeat protein [Polyangia bacterium]
MTRAACPDEATLSRAMTSGPDDALARHLRTCATCQPTWAAWEHAIALARTLPTHVPPAARREELRVALLASAGAAPVAADHRTAWLGSAAVLAAVAVVALWLGHRRHEPQLVRSHAALSPAVGTRYAVVAPRPRETVRLWEGALALEVDPLGPGERFVVEVGDGEVEVRGTKFAVIARADRLVRVEVTHGRVEVRPSGAALVILEAGQSWTAPAQYVRESAPVPAAAPPAPQVRAPIRRVAQRASMDVEHAAQPRQREAQQEAQYDDAWDALRAHDYEKAADGFARVLRDSPEAPLADEAAFWRATALARGDDSQAALSAFRQMLDAYPQSPRRGEASTILGWLLIAAHAPTEAADRFRAAIDDPHEDVRASAREGLETLAPRPAH